MWKKLFAIPFPERLGRLNFLWREVGLSYWLIMRLLSFEDGIGTDDFLPSVLFLAAGLLYLMVFVRMPRTYDAGLRPIWVLLTLVPFVSYVFGVFLLFKRSEPRVDGRPWPPSAPPADS